MSAVSEAWVVKHSPYTGATFHVHKAIAEIVNKERGWLFYGRLTELSKKTRIDRKTIGAALPKFVKDGYLVEVRPAMVLIERDGMMQWCPTGRPAVYRFVFQKDAAVVYDADGQDLAVDDAPGGEADSSPPVDVIRFEEFHPGISAGHSTAGSGSGDASTGGEADSSPPCPQGEANAAPGGESTSRGEESASRNSIELNQNFSSTTTPPNPHCVGAQPTRDAGTNPRATATAPRDLGTNPRAQTVDWFLEGARVDDADPVLVEEHLHRIHDALGRGLEHTTTGGAQP